MTNFSKFGVFLLANGIGFFSVPICYYLGRSTGVLKPSDPEFNVAMFETWFLGGIMMTWLACAIFSVAYFFIGGKMGRMFLLAPVILPLAYGLSVLYGSF